MRTYRVQHRTSYTYSTAMNDGFTIATLLPRSTAAQRVVTASISVDPLPDEYEETADSFGNRVVRFAVHRPHDRLVVTAVSETEVVEAAVAGGTAHSDGLGNGSFARQAQGPTVHEVVTATASAGGPLAVELAPFRGSSALVCLDDTAVRAAIDDVAPVSDAGAMHVAGSALAFVTSLCHAIHQGFRFDPGFSDVATPLAEVFAARRGVCQDFAHVAVACLRQRGFAARYVSGYIETVPPEGQAKLIGADASHAWCEVWLGALGWVAFDPTNDQLPPRAHVVVGWGRDYADLAPVRGVVVGPPSTQTLDIAVDVVSETRQ